MIRHIWSVLCEKSVIDSDSNNISLLNVLEQLVIELPKDTKFPVNIPASCQVVSLWSRDEIGKEEPITVKMEFCDPSGKKVGEHLNTFHFGKDRKRFRTRFNINGLGFNNSGEYKFVISLISEKKVIIKNEVPLQVIIKQKQQ